VARETPELHGGSLADIAFLPLIFFLVTTTMDTDTGITRLLPPEPVEIPEGIRSIFKMNISESEPKNIKGLNQAYTHLRIYSFFILIFLYQTAAP